MVSNDNTRPRAAEILVSGSTGWCVGVKRWKI